MISSLAYVNKMSYEPALEILVLILQFPTGTYEVDESCCQIK